LLSLHCSQQQQIADNQHTISQQAKKITYQHPEIEKLRFQLNKQLGHRFSAHSEKGLSGQLHLFDEANLANADVQAIKEADACIALPGHTRNKRGRKPLPADLPREIIIHDLAPDKKNCACGQPLHKIGEDTSEQLEIIPAQFKVLRGLCVISRVVAVVKQGLPVHLCRISPYQKVLQHRAYWPISLCLN